MRAFKFFSFILILFLAGCASEIHQKIKLDIPAYSPIKMQEFNELILVPFIISAETPKPATGSNKESLGAQKEEEREKTEKEITLSEEKKIEPKVDVQGELMKYFRDELGRRFNGKIRQESIALTSPDVIHKPEYWQSLGTNAQDSLVFTGHGRFQQEIRKAILYRSDLYRADQSEGELFAPEKKLASRHVFTLELNVALIRPDNGEIVFERNFKETKITPDLNYPARFALYELMQRIKLILFRQIFGEERPQERYLLMK